MTTKHVTLGDSHLVYGARGAIEFNRASGMVSFHTMVDTYADGHDCHILNTPCADRSASEEIAVQAVNALASGGETALYAELDRLYSETYA